jgi:peptide/nickel transport system substrate-binding protein
VGGSTAFAYLQLNTREGSPVPVLRDVRVRQALMHAIDRDTLVRYLVGDGAEVLHVPCHPSAFGCDANGARRYDYNPALARQLLAEAGYARGFTLEIASSMERGETEAIMGYLRAVGIDAGLRFMATAARVTALRANRSAASYGILASTIGDASAVLSRLFQFSADDTNRDAEVRDLLVRADSSMDPAVRTEAYSAALALITERAYMVPLYIAPTYYVAGSELVFDPSADGRPRFYEMAWQ